MADLFRPELYVGVGLVRSHQRILSRIDELTEMAKLRPLLQAALENPRLTVLDQGDWDKVGLSLRECGQIQNVPAFARYMRMLERFDTPSFMTSPGSRMGDHHSYPGGLVYHTLADIELALGIAGAYEGVYGVKASRDTLIAALAMHDLAKGTVFPWTDEGAYPDEMLIAGTEGHHVLSISEAILRGFPAEVVQSMAFCHVKSAPPELDLRSFLAAAYLICGRTLPDGIGAEITLEDWICRYADSDCMISAWACQRRREGEIDRTRHDPRLYRLLAADTEFRVFRIVPLASEPTESK